MPRPTRTEENRLYRLGYNLIAGVDEVGRGAWAGPLVAAAVILSKKFRLPGINDSKKLSSSQRETFYQQIIKQSIAHRIYVISHQQIDKHGIMKVNLKAIKKSVSHLAVKPEFVLIDNFKVTWSDIPAKSIKQGDAKVVAIAAASIIAKVARDRLMIRYHQQYPNYNFAQHKGYGTVHHRRKISRYGPCSLHRLSFAPMKYIN